jgi:hypothetical protein
MTLPLRHSFCLAKKVLGHGQNWIHLYHLIYHIHFHKKLWLLEHIYKQQNYTNKLANICILLMRKEILEHSYDTIHYEYIKLSCNSSSANTANLTQQTCSFVLTSAITHPFNRTFKWKVPDEQCNTITTITPFHTKECSSDHEKCNNIFMFNMKCH